MIELSLLLIMLVPLIVLRHRCRVFRVQSCIYVHVLLATALTAFKEKRNAQYMYVYEAGIDLHDHWYYCIARNFRGV